MPDFNEFIRRVFKGWAPVPEVLFMAAWEHATEAERERCAKIAESWTGVKAGQHIADAIRRSGDAPTRP